jgi:hypothetical protein
MSGVDTFLIRMDECSLENRTTFEGFSTFLIKNGGMLFGGWYNVREACVQGERSR